MKRTGEKGAAGFVAVLQTLVFAGYALAVFALSRVTANHISGVWPGRLAEKEA